MFEVIDPVLRIENCNISDLTIEEVDCFLKQWEKGDKISSLTAFYRNDGTLVLNKDNQNYQEILEFCKNYMTATEEEKQSIKENVKASTWIPELIVLMENCLKNRYIAEEMKVISFLPVSTQFETDILQAIWKKYYQRCNDIRFIISIAYMYGKVQGKREERARRKKKCQDIKGKIIENIRGTQYSRSLDQLLVLSKILGKKCKADEYIYLSKKEQMIGFIIDNLMKCNENDIDIAYTFLETLCND